MNRELILRVADAIENETVPGLRYDQETWGRKDECGTTACIAGMAWSVAHNGNTELPCCDIASWKRDHVFQKAKTLMDLTTDQADDLMYQTAEDRASWEADDYRGEPALITRQEAAATLRHLAATGRVEWVELPETWEKTS